VHERPSILESSRNAVRAKGLPISSVPRRIARDEGPEEQHAMKGGAHAVEGKCSRSKRNDGSKRNKQGIRKRDEEGETQKESEKGRDEVPEG